MNTQITQARLAAHHLAARHSKSIKDTVDWMGAIQAQDYQMAKWAIGIRLPSSTNTQVEEAFRQGQILRTHVMRPTWHLVTPENLRWMTQLSAQRIKTSSQSRDRDLGITEQLYSATNNLIAQTLQGNNHLTRESLSTILERNKIPADYPRMIHYLMRAEVEGIICSGIPQGKEQTYALYSERVPDAPALHREEALARLAANYFRSHSPATVADFYWWSGLGMADVRLAINAIKHTLLEESVDGQTYLVSTGAPQSPTPQSAIHLLPAFDEYIISYKDRTAALSSAHHSKAISSNGVFRPVILTGGTAAALWKKPTPKGNIAISAFHEDAKIDGTSSFAHAVHNYQTFISN